MSRPLAAHSAGKASGAHGLCVTSSSSPLPELLLDSSRLTASSCLLSRGCLAGLAGSRIGLCTCCRTQGTMKHCTRPAMHTAAAAGALACSQAGHKAVACALRMTRASTRPTVPPNSNGRATSARCSAFAACVQGETVALLGKCCSAELCLQLAVAALVAVLARWCNLRPGPSSRQILQV